MKWTTYRSMWDWSTWLILFIVEISVGWIFFMEDAFWIALAIFLATNALMLTTLLGIYYRIVGNELWVYGFFHPTKLPIDKISEIQSTKSVLSAPATSLIHRLAIKFSDRKVLKSSMPVIISPVRQKEFVAQLRAINPNIRVDIS